MALIAHYPLNGDTKDYSGYGNDGVSTGAVVSNTGKIGGSYKFDGVSSGVNIPNVNYIAMEVYSMAAWVKPLGYHKNYNGAVISSGDWNYASWNFGLSQDNSKIDVASKGYNKYLDYPVPVGEWTHIVCVAENNFTKVYVNGNYVGQVSATSKLTSNAANTCIGRETYAGGYFAFNGELNDIRIYDHALSDKEVKEIAKAKVLHYKFDDHEEPTENVWSGNLNIYNNYGVPATLVDTGKSYKGAKILRLGMTVPNASAPLLEDFRVGLYNHGVYGGGMTFLANTKYAASILWRPVNKGDVVVGGTASNISGWVSKGSTYEGDGWNRFTAVRDGSVTTNKTDNIFFSFICPSMQLDETVFVEFCAPQVEVGKDYSTPYVMGVRHGSVKDSSGFGNDGTVAVATAPTWSEDSPVGRGSMGFSGAQEIDTQGTFNFGKEDYFTISVWINPEDHSSKEGAAAGILGKGHWFDNTWDLFMMNSNSVTFECSGGPAMHGRVALSSPVMAINTWANIIVVYNAGLISMYVNGVLYSTTTYNGTGGFTNPNQVYVGKRAGDNSRRFMGNISDVRIYATALSPEDILEIYQTRASVDNLGNLFVQEFDEVSIPAGKSIRSNGIAQFTELNEITSVDKMSIGNDGTLYVNEIKEA